MMMISFGDTNTSTCLPSLWVLPPAYTACCKKLCGTKHLCTQQVTCRKSDPLPTRCLQLCCLDVVTMVTIIWYNDAYFSQLQSKSFDLHMPSNSSCLWTLQDFEYQILPSAGRQRAWLELETHTHTHTPKLPAEESSQGGCMEFTWTHRKRANPKMTTAIAQWPIGSNRSPLLWSLQQ